MYSDLTQINKMQFSRIFRHHLQIFDLREMLLYYLQNFSAMGLNRQIGSGQTLDYLISSSSQKFFF